MKAIADVMSSVAILLVEDEPVALELLVAILKKRFQAVRFYTAINGKKGLELFMEHTPDIVITDLKMPEMSGVQMAEKIRAIKQNTKFIVLTGDFEKNAHQDSSEKKFEFDHCIMKPVDFGALFTAIEHCFKAIAHQRRESGGDIEQSEGTVAGQVT